MKRVERAYAKVNLTLRVGSRRPDGYHEIETVMQTVGLYDTVTVTVGGDSDRLVCRTPVTARPEDDLCMKALAAFSARVERREKVTIRVEKRIPVQAGLGGGSSDAAAVLRGLRHLLAPELSDGELETIAATLGSDVPFFIRGGTALATGRGELLTPLSGLKQGWLVVVKPEESFSTAEMYRRLDAVGLPEGETIHLRDALERGDVASLAAGLYNSFEAAVPEGSDVWRIKELLTRCGAAGTLLSGSGSAVFALFEKRWPARIAAETLRQRWPQTVAVQPAAGK